ncbi:MAG: putative glycoside hydrolase [Patescibacteria group bacterium]
MPNKKRALSVFAVFLVSVVFGGFFLYKCNFIEIEKPVEKQVNPVFKSANYTTTTVAKNSDFTSTSDAVLEKPEITEEKKAVKAAALKRADVAKGVYINGYAAAAKTSTVRENIKNLLSETELNAIVIDVKEADGPYMPVSMKKFIEELHRDNIWVIARICVFRDSSLTEENPEWYLKYNSTTSATTSEFWKDSGGGYWLDPANPDVQNYIINFSKKVIDFGFDELQFDYVRFPSDGQIRAIVYPFYNSEEKDKFGVMKDFFSKISESLRSYSHSTILSVDLFGYIATQYQSGEIGQRVSDAADIFDYISFMLYPSHFYGGFSIPGDADRQLPAVYFPYDATDTERVASSHPYEVIFRSIIFASDYLAKLKSQTKIRPWLQDFNINPDTNRGIYYDAEKVKAQIQAAEDAGAAGWLLWNASNVYTKAALTPE